MTDISNHRRDEGSTEVPPNADGTMNVLQSSRDDHTSGRSTGTAALGVPGWLVVLLATASGMTVANLYYAQPLLSSLRDVFHVGETAQPAG
ncbi:hypothetical protein ACRJ4W_49325 [Streptomyces sp. GLT-R25]